MSLPNQFDIYLAKPRLRHSSDLRPVIVIEASQRGIVDVLPISSTFDLYDSSRHFLIQKVHPNFSATGLARMSFLPSTQPLAIHSAELNRRLGRLEDTLLAEFKEWCGL